MTTAVANPSLRHGKWKLLLARGSGGWSVPKEGQVEAGTLEAQLYDMEKDAGETNNLYTKRPDITKRLLALMKEDVDSGRSTAGPASQNDFNDIVLWKSGRGPAPAKSKK